MILVFWQECKNDLKMALQSTFWRLQQSLQNRVPRVQVLLPLPSKDTIEIWNLKFRLNGVFIINPSIYAAFRGRIFFLQAGLKTEKLKLGNPKI